MSFPPPEDLLVNLGTLARLVGVGPSAVSNWRKRHPTFPKPVETSADGKDLFRMDDLNHWLKATGRDPIAVADDIDLVRQLADRVLGSTDMVLHPGLAGLILAYKLALAGRPALIRDLAETDSPSELLNELLDVAQLPHGHYRPMFEPLLRLISESPGHVEGFGELEPDELLESAENWVQAVSTVSPEHGTSAPVRELVARLAPRAASIYDPASGTGELLAAVLSLHEVPPDLVAAQELAPVASLVTAFRLLARDIDAHHVHIGDSLLADAEPNLLVDLVVCDPPHGSRSWGAEQVIGDQRFQFASPTNRDPNGAWLQHALAHMDANATGIVVLPAIAMSATGKPADLRRALVAAGAVEAVIALPGGMAHGTAIPLSVWILRTPSASNRSRPVLLIDAADPSFLMPSTDGPRALVPARLTDVINQVLGFRAKGQMFESTPGFAALVPIPDLLSGRSTNLAPQQWVAPVVADAGQLTSGLQQRINELVTTLDALADQLPIPHLVIDEPAASTTPMRIIDLIDAGVVDVLRGGRPIGKQDYTTEGIGVLTPAALARGREVPRYDRFIDDADCDERPRTQRGDIAFASIAAQPFAVVLDDGGAVVGQGVEVLRIRANWLDPHVVAACLSSPLTTRPSAVAAAGTQRVRLRDLALPPLTDVTTATMHAVLARLTALEAGASRLTEAIEHTTALLVEAAVTGKEISGAD